MKLTSRGIMAVICRSGGYNCRRMCSLRKIALATAVLIGVVGFSFGDDNGKKCDLVNKDFERTVKLSHLQFLQEPQKGKRTFLLRFYLSLLLFVYDVFFEQIMQVISNPPNVRIKHFSF